MEFRQLKYFKMLSEIKNYSQAAELLYITQPTLTWNIKKLEEEMNVQLILQNSTGLELTKAGDVLLEHTDKILDTIDDLTYQIEQIQQNKKIEIKVGITTLFSVLFMEEIINFMNSYPDIQLTFIQEGSKSLQKKITNQTIDVGILSFPVFEPDIKIQQINSKNANYKIHIVVRKDHPLKDKTSVTFSDLIDYPICSFTSDFVIYEILYNRCKALGFKPNVAFLNNNWEVLLQNVRATGNIALMPNIVHNIKANDDLCWIPLEDKSNHFDIGVATARDKPLSQPVLQFMNHFKIK